MVAKCYFSIALTSRNVPIPRRKTICAQSMDRRSDVYTFIQGDRHASLRQSRVMILVVSGWEVNAWERRTQARYFCSLSFAGLKERFFCGNGQKRS